MINRIYFNRRQKIIINDYKDNNESGIILDRYIATLLKNIESFGYTFSEKLIEHLGYTSKIEIFKLHKEILEILSDAIGQNAKSKLIYPNFPQQLMEMDESEIYLNSLMYYLSGGKIKPEYEKIERTPLLDSFELKVIDLGSKEDFQTILTNLLSSKGSLSEKDKEDIKWFINNMDDVRALLPTKIKFKEILTYTTPLLMGKEDEYLLSQYKTATDVLRLATAMSDGDISLSTNTKFKSFSRKERREILSLLENCSSIEEDMNRYKDKWIRLGERLHPGEYKRFKKANIAFNKLRNNIKIDTFASKLEASYREKNLEKVVELLSKRPGEFGRGLDRALRLSYKLDKDFKDKRVNRIIDIISSLDYEVHDDLVGELDNLKSIAKDINNYREDKIINAFQLVAHKMPSSLLLQIREHFKHRFSNEFNVRVFQPKGGRARTFGMTNKLTPLNRPTCEKIISICEQNLKDIYSKREPLKKVYIDDELKKFIVPMSQRNASKGLRTVARGSRIGVNAESKALRMFIYWKEPTDVTIDIDLSAVLYDKNFNVISEIGYFDLIDTRLNCVHSGDFIEAPEGASEFIDIDVEMVKKYNIKYVAMILNSYTEVPFNEIPECFAGIMEREYPSSGEVYDARTVKSKIDISSSSQIAMPIIVDVENRELVWSDITVSKSEYKRINNVRTNKNPLIYNMKSIVNIIKPNIFDLIRLNAEARGEIVESKEEADIIFSVDEGITPFDMDILMANFL